MHCPACKVKVQATEAECPKCLVDLRWSVRGPNGQLQGPYTVAELQGYAALGNVQPWTWLESKYGDVIQYSNLGAEKGLPAASVPAAATAGSSHDWRQGASVTLAIAFGVLMVVSISIWLTIMAPALKQSEKSAASVGCLRNASMLVEALRLYAAEHDGNLPDAATWREDVGPYLPPGECPSCGETEAIGAGYEMNPAYSGAQLITAGDQPLIYDTGWMSGQPGPHRGLYTVAFADGTTVWMPPEG